MSLMLTPQQVQTICELLDRSTHAACCALRDDFPQGAMMFTQGDFWAVIRMDGSVVEELSAR